MKSDHYVLGTELILIPLEEQKVVWRNHNAHSHVASFSMSNPNVHCVREKVVRTDQTGGYGPEVAVEQE